MYQILKQIAITGIKTETLERIVEFGGGYGAMSAVVRRLGFTGDYYIYDLPEFLILQEYYLSNMGFEFKPKEVDSHDRFQMTPDNVDLLIACYSLSEVTRDLREAFFHTVSPKYALFAIQKEHGAYNVHDEFMNLAVRNPRYTWTFNENKFRPGFNHVIAVRKETE